MEAPTDKNMLWIGKLLAKLQIKYFWNLVYTIHMLTAAHIGWRIKNSTGDITNQHIDVNKSNLNTIAYNI